MHNYTCEVSSRGGLAEWARAAPRFWPDGAVVAIFARSVSSAGTKRPRESFLHHHAILTSLFRADLAQNSARSILQSLTPNTERFDRREARIGGRCLMCNAGGTFLVNCIYKPRVQEVIGQPLLHLQSANLEIQIPKLIYSTKLSNLIAHHRPQTRAREDRRAGSIEQAPCTIALIGEIPSRKHS